MELYTAIQVRKSVRSYLPKPIPEEVLRRILEAGRISPSSVNRQPWHFIVVTDPEKMKVLAEGPYARFLAECPAAIVGLGDKVASPKWHVVDTTIALQTMVLAATAEGLGTCWIGSFHEDKIKKLLKIPDNFVIVAMLSLGYPKEKNDLLPKPVEARSRKGLKDITSSEEFGRKSE